MALVQVRMLSSCSNLTPPPPVAPPPAPPPPSCADSISRSPPPPPPPRTPRSAKEAKCGEGASLVVESSEVLFCSSRRAEACCAPCWLSGVVTDVGTECTIWIPPMGIIGNGERTWNTEHRVGSRTEPRCPLKNTTCSNYNGIIKSN